MADNMTFQWNGTPSQISNNLGLNEKLNLFTAETCARYMNPFVPMETGVLSQTYIAGSDNKTGYVKYIQPYAHRLYVGTGLNFSKEMHPLATSYWDRAMWTVHKNKVTKEVDAYRKRLSK